jgi:hypothetical protein
VPKMMYQLPYNPNRDRYNKLSMVCQVTLPLVCGVGATLPQSDISLLSNAVAMATATWHTDIPLTSSTTILTYKSIFNPLLTVPAQTHVLQLNCLPLLYTEVQFLKIYTSQTTVIPFSETILPLSWDTMSHHFQC